MSGRSKWRAHGYSPHPSPISARETQTPSVLCVGQQISATTDGFNSRDSVILRYYHLSKSIFTDLISRKLEAILSQFRIMFALVEYGRFVGQVRNQSTSKFTIGPAIYHWGQSYDQASCLVRAEACQAASAS